MRELQFKMERQGLVAVADEVLVSERSPNAGLYTYVVEPSVAMSGIFRSTERLHSRKGIIKDIKETERGFYLVVEFDE